LATSIWLVRHGETQANVDGIFQGHLDTQLNDQGNAQARSVARALRDIHFDAIYASDLARAACTAEAIAEGRDTDLNLEPALREMHYGVLQGARYLDFREILTQHGVAEEWGPGLFSANGMAPPEGESIQDLRDRLASFVERLDIDHPPESGKSILLVAHGGTFRTLITVLLDLPVSARTAFAFSNCSVTRIAREPGQSRLELHNAVYWDSIGSSTRTGE
jgi:broad specificity phosphatase PhoE